MDDRELDQRLRIIEEGIAILIENLLEKQDDGIKVKEKDE